MNYHEAMYTEYHPVHQIETKNFSRCSDLTGHKAI